MKRIIKYLLLCITTLGLLGVGVIFTGYLYLASDLPSITKVHDYRMPEVTTVYAADGSMMGYFFEEKRFLVNMDAIPQHVINAFLAAEDASFYQHQGLDYRGIARAFISNLMSGKIKGGGSTITQQVVKRILLDGRREYVRKFREMILAHRLEKYLSKDEILYIYLNQIFFGNNAYGVESAARTYFGKHVGDLTIAEAAMLAGIPKAPSDNNPYSQPENAMWRQRYVLKQMWEKGFIQEDAYQAAVNQKLEYKAMPEPSWNFAGWYLEEVRRQLISFFSEENLKAYNLEMDLPIEGLKPLYGKDALYRGGYNIYTAMNPVHQKAAEHALRSGLHEACKRRGWRGPITNIPQDKYNAFISASRFKPSTLDNAGWAKALVTHVAKDKADVILGHDSAKKEYKGTITIRNMGWARVPNTNISPEAAGQVRDATRILAPGDIVWVSAVGARGDLNPVMEPAKKDITAYNSTKVTSATELPLSLEQVPDLQGAVASIDIASRNIVALVGGYAFSPESQFNRATQAQRQPGSSFKPIVYSAALDHGFTAGSILLDSPFVQAAGPGRQAWRPGNFDGKFLGPIILRTALAKSRNVCTVRVAQQVGMEAIIQRAKDLGITGNIPPVLAVSLGSYEATPLKMAEAYTAFANAGVRISPRLITHINSRWDEPLIEFQPGLTEAITPQNAYIMATLLKEVVNAGTGGRARVLGRPVAGKTGTSNDERDAWFIGFSPYLVTSVYVGYDNNAPMGRMETGGKAALPIFVKYRQAIDSLYPPEDFSVPQGITMARVDANSGYLSSSGGEGFVLPFVTGTEPRLHASEALGPSDPDSDTSVEIFKQF